ncbi:MAG: CpaF family protein [Candidatus Omnitrophota bacterium]|nr:CpaF family protein [Candidatus Omnitrophota bacterium]
MDERFKLKEKIKEQLHSRLPASFFLKNSKAIEDELHRATLEVTNAVLRRERGIAFSPEDQRKLVEEVVDEILGLGVLEGLIADESITEIMVNGPGQIYIERNGKLELTDIRFSTERELMILIERMLSPLGRRVNESETYVDARLKDGFRVNIVIAPTASGGPVISIHKFSHQVFSIQDFIGFKTLTEEAAEFLKASVSARLNIIVSGGTSCGKTTLLNVLSSYIPANERVIIIEDTLELRPLSPHVVRLEARLANIEGKGGITIRDLLRNALHMRPDRIIVGEIRGEEVLDMLQAMNTGHEGSMTTLHASAPEEAMSRMEVMALMGGANLSSQVIMRQIISAADLIVHMERTSEGLRRITHITEVGKEKTDQYALRDIFSLPRDVFKDNAELILTGTKPSFYPQLKKSSGYINKKFEQL